MGIKFDGTYVKNGSKVVANMKRTDELKRWHIIWRENPWQY